MPGTPRRQRDDDFLRRYLDTEERVENAWRRYGEGDLSAGNTAWVNLTLAAGWGVGGSGFVIPQWRLVNDMIVLRGRAVAAAWSDAEEKLVATLPSDACPGTTVNLFGTFGSTGTNQAIPVRVETDGEVYATKPAGGPSNNLWLDAVRFPYG